MSSRSLLTLSRKIFPSEFGLDHDLEMDAWGSLMTLGEGRVDHRTSAAQVVTSKTSHRPHEEKISLSIDYWNMRPDGEQTTVNIIDFEFSLQAASDDVDPVALWVMGRKLYEAPTGQENIVLSGGMVKNVNRARSAVKYIHRALRRGDLPDMAGIFGQTGLSESLGERLSIIGQGQNSPFQYPYYGAQPEMASKPVVFPLLVARALFGEDVNDLDPHQRMGQQRLVTEVDPRHGIEFAFRALAVSDDRKIKSDLMIQPISIPDDVQAFSIPGFSSLQLDHEASQDLTRLSEFRFLGLDLLKADPATRMKIIGVINRVKSDLRRRDYPKVMDYLAEYDLLELTDDLTTRDHLTPPPPDGRLVTEARLGHNTGDPVIEGYGHKPDGNCTIIEVQWTNGEGRLARVGAGHDLGLSLPDEDVANRGAIADVARNLTYIDHWFLTHDHLDHKSGFIPYIAKGYFRSKMIYGTPEQIRSLREELNAYDYPEEYNPVFKEIRGRGCVHIRDADGVTRLSVVYSAEGTPHTARCTPYMYVARNGSKVIDTYLNPGDMRFGQHNAEGYTGEKPDVDYLDTYFFRNWARILLENDPTVEPSVLGFPVVRCDFDGTSIMKPGFAPTDWLCEKNRNILCHILDEIVPGKHWGVSQISSNEMGFESWLRVATQQGRDVTAAGANIERKARTLNVHGVNKLRLQAQKRRNIQLYLDQYFEQQGNARLQDLEQKRHEAIHPSVCDNLDREILMERMVQQYFCVLRKARQSNRRIRQRDELEAEFRSEFGQHRHLGSIYTSITSDVSRRISRQPERWLTLETGTQGSFVEIDSTTYKRSEGRSRFDMRADQKHTARPLPPQKTILCIAQTAIPGKDRKQREMVSRLVARGYIVVLSVHDGFEIHGLNSRQSELMRNALESRGYETGPYDNEALAVINMPIHPPGHGYVRDMEEWLKLINPVFPMLQHTGDHQAIQRFDETAQRTLGRRGSYFENFDRVTSWRGSNDDWQLATLGRSVPSMIEIEVKREVRKYYGGHIEVTRYVKLDGHGGLSQDGLMASAQDRGSYRQAFANVSTELERRRKAANDEGKRPEPVPYNREPMVSERLHRGPVRPDDDLYDVDPGLRRCAA